MAKDDTAKDIGATLIRLADPGMSPKELFKLTRKAHPKASRKQILHAAFGSLIAVSETDLDKARVLQNFAITQHGGEE